jgi:anti-sigma factor RsiW
MQQDVDETEVLISGYLDGELDETSRLRVEAMMAESPSFRREVEAMRRLITGTEAACSVHELPQEVWDDFLDDVYNRLERRTGWSILLLGAGALAVYLVFLYVAKPWAGPVEKVLLALPIIGLAILFISVLRQRMKALKHDRYTREIHR